MAQGSGGTSPTNITHHLSGIDFPASKDDLISHAKKNEAEKEVLNVPQAMPDQEYGNMADVMKSVGEVE